MSRRGLRDASSAIKQAQQLLSRYDYTPDHLPPLAPNRSLDDDMDRMLRSLK